MMHLIDSHCHFDQLEISTEEALQNAMQNHVQQFLCVSITLDNFPKLVSIAEQHAQIYISVGLHPNELVTTEPQARDLIKLANHKKVVAIGETGLDYYRSVGDTEWQRQRFREHIKAAQAINKPIIVHTRQAKEDTIRILKEENAASIGGVMHCFTEDWKMAEAALNLNFYISFSGIVTFRNAKTIQEVAKKVPLDRLLIETDSPYLAPEPYRGKANQPAYVRFVAEYLAKLRNIDLEEIAEKTTENFSRLFKIDRNDGHGLAP